MTIIYRLAERFAYSRIGKWAATVIRDRWYPNARTHWVQQAMADLSFDGLRG